MECAKILLHPQQFGELDKYIKGKWAMGSQSDSVSEMGADRRRHLQAVVGALVLKILDCAKGGKADQAGALAFALKNKGLMTVVTSRRKMRKMRKTTTTRTRTKRVTTSRDGPLLAAALIPLVLSRIESILIYLESVGILDTRHSELAADPSNSNFYFIKLQS